MFGKGEFLLRTFTELRGMPVVDVDDGLIAGFVSDVCFDANGSFIGLLINEKGIFRKGSIVPAETICTIGKDGIMVNGRSSLKSMSEFREAYFLQSHRRIQYKAVYSTEGEKLGLLADVYFSEQVGTIVAYELTDGFFADMMEGKRMIDPPGSLTISKDAIVMDFIH
ncbi:photosystem reaction center subunit H [Bacillus idriensis]|uniref:Photosystem reaction center subunit H n=1 Tax=Metabacillus idriensis TaxID=324768 RepID=A0A6I2MFT7_9BACI|nr:PRC-barrel domain-containing protein [Metabacillus idriensis]MRX55896.1 photosystem reaction center subunit H [Metabacillus idriensis]